MAVSIPASAYQQVNESYALDTSGLYTRRVQFKGTDFDALKTAAGNIERGDAYVNNRCAVGMSQLVLNGKTYNLGTATIDGHTVLTLTPAN